MHFPTTSYHIRELIAEHLPCLSGPQQQGLAWWVLGAVLGRSACQTRVVTALLSFGTQWDGVRQHLREWLYDGPDKAAPTRTQVEVGACFAALLGWVVAWQTPPPPGQRPQVALALDATLLRDRVAAWAEAQAESGSGSTRSGSTSVSP